jgi:hypothetical protein
MALRQDDVGVELPGIQNTEGQSFDVRLYRQAGCRCDRPSYGGSD